MKERNKLQVFLSHDSQFHKARSQTSFPSLTLANGRLLNIVRILTPANLVSIFDAAMTYRHLSGIIGLAACLLNLFDT